ncbi:MAG TPA: fused MFS/spermidine synthase, partial [Vicinamibacterales bacterium]|nr:fused MFS/spermidine synthase [Vicinamibacterales bacterium]
LLVIFSGADVYSVTIIVAAFMGGLGVGSLVGGRLADRLGARASLWAFAGVEFLIGLFGLISKRLYYDALYMRFPDLAATPGIAAVVLFASLLVPTFLMGLSLPLIARGLVGTLAATGRVVGSLYGWNTLGAATGALAGTWVLLPRIGVERAIWTAAALNLCCAVLALLLARKKIHEGSEAIPGAAQQNPPPVSQLFPFRVWVVVFGLTGFIALGLEIAWFRLLGVMLKSGAFTFGTLLAVYLSGLGLGAAIGARRVARSHQPGLTFLALQYALTLYVAFSMVALMALIASGHPIKLVRYFGEYEPVDVFTTVAMARDLSWTNLSALNRLVEFAILYVVVPAALIGPPTFLMGMSFPYLQKASQVDLARLGRRLGVLLSSNIAGSVLGTVVAGWLLIPALGTAGTLKVLTGLGVILALPLGWIKWPGKPLAATGAALAAVLVSAAAVIAMPDGETLWARLHAADTRHVLLAEDAAGLSLLKAESPSFRGTIAVYVNGLGQSSIPYGNIHTALGALPVLIHPAPRDVVIIGLGSGDTAFGAATHPDVQQVTCVEIIGAQLDTLRRLARIHPDPGLTALLSNPRVLHEVGDGRMFVRQAGRRFDIIEADALRPTSAHAGNLYSREYFDLLRRHLKPGGLAVTWAPTERTEQTFLSVFPYVLGFGGIYIGSEAPIAFDRDRLVARAEEVREYYEAAGVDIMTVLQPYLDSVPRSFGPHDRRPVADLNTDTFPRDEFALPF